MVYGTLTHDNTLFHNILLARIRNYLETFWQIILLVISPFKPLHNSYILLFNDGITSNAAVLSQTKSTSKTYQQPSVALGYSESLLNWFDLKFRSNKSLGLQMFLTLYESRNVTKLLANVSTTNYRLANKSYMFLCPKVCNYEKKEKFIYFCYFYRNYKHAFKNLSHKSIRLSGFTKTNLLHTPLKQLF